MTAMSAADRSSSPKYSYIDTKGKVVTPHHFSKKYDRYGSFSEGICMAGTKLKSIRLKKN